MTHHTTSTVVMSIKSIGQKKTQITNIWVSI